MAVWHVGKPADASVKLNRGTAVYLAYPAIDAPDVVYYKGRPAPLIGGKELEATRGRYAGVAEAVFSIGGTGLVAVSTRVCGTLNADGATTTRLYINETPYAEHRDKRLFNALFDTEATGANEDVVSVDEGAGRQLHTPGTMAGCGQATEHGMVVWPYGHPR